MPDELGIKIVSKEELITDWHLFQNYPYTQALGDAWIAKGETVALGVPSAIIVHKATMGFQTVIVKKRGD